MLTWEILGVVFVVALGALIVGRRLRANVFSVLLVAGIVALAVAVTVVQVQQYWTQRAPVSAVAVSQPATGVRAIQPPAADRSWSTSAPMITPPTGSAAPPAARNPTSGSGR
jgi:thiol:disulfide interchange protein